MHNPPTVKNGDKVKVTIEGTVYEHFADNSFVVRPEGRDQAPGIHVDATRTIVTDVEVLKPPLKVGDLLVSGQFTDAPVGTVLGGFNATQETPVLVKKPGDKWVDLLFEDVTHSSGNLCTPRVILFVPST